MQVSSTKINSNTIEILVKDSSKEFEKAREEVISDIAANVVFKGFRKGSVPRETILKEYGEANLAERAINKYLDRNYSKILEKSSVVPVSAGVVKNIVSTSPIELVIEIEVLPEVEIDEKKLAKISVKKTEVTVTKEDALKALSEIERRFTHFHEAGSHGEDGFVAEGTTIATGDRVTIDTQGFEGKGGKEIPETKVAAFPLVIGSGQFIPGFEEKLMGAKVGEVVEFDIVFPADYHAPEFQNRKVFFVTTIFKVEKPHTPTIDEDFVERLRGVRTDRAGLLEILEKEVLAERERQAREKDETALLTELRSITKLELGANLIAHEIENIWNEQKSNLEAQGYNMKDYLSHVGQDEESYKKNALTSEAERRLSAELILKKLREIKNIEATDDEVAVEIAHIISQYQSEQVIERLKAKLVPGDTYYEDIKNRLAYRKVVDSFLR